MKHEFKLEDVDIPRAGIAVLNCELRLYSDAADSTLSAADFSTAISQQTKTSIEGQTAQDLINRIRPELITKSQQIIDKYAAEQQIASKTAVINLIADVDGTLSS